MKKLLYFFKYILHPIRENFEAWSCLVLDIEDGFDEYLEDDCYIYVISEPKEIVGMFYNELDWFSPSNRYAEDFFDWYE